MARPRKTKDQLLKEYATEIEEIFKGTPYRTMARDDGIGLSTLVRLNKKIVIK